MSASLVHAQSPLTVIGGTERIGSIDMFLLGPAGTEATVFEDVRGRLIPVQHVPLVPGAGFAPDVGRWRCDRLHRRFVVLLRLADGSVASQSYETRTPSCRHRFLVRLPRRARAIEGARLTLIDRWGTGDVRPRVCTAPRRRRLRCRGLPLEVDQVRGARQLDFPRGGRWRVEVRIAGHRIRRQIGVRATRQFVLRGAPARLQIQLAGDSMITNVDRALRDRLGGEAEVLVDQHIGTGLAKPGFNWIAQARREVSANQSDAVVVLLGGNDGFGLTTPAGLPLPCCGEAWVAEYARRVQAMMQIYLRRGGSVPIWLTVPAPPDERGVPAAAAVNQAIRQAAASTPGAHVVGLDEVITPGFRYQTVIRRNGRQVRVRGRDGFHLSVAGARIMASLVHGELGRLGLL